MTWDRWLVLVLIVVNLGLAARNTWLMYRLHRRADELELRRPPRDNWGR
jgi:hypothetical protein